MIFSGLLDLLAALLQLTGLSLSQSTNPSASDSVTLRVASLSARPSKPPSTSTPSSPSSSSRSPISRAVLSISRARATVGRGSSTKLYACESSHSRSTGGRYLPLFASEIVHQNERLAKRKSKRTPINLQSVLIGNGLTDIVSRPTM
jgi:hypothetical protein